MHTLLLGLYEEKGSDGAAAGASDQPHQHPDTATGGTRGTPGADRPRWCVQIDFAGGVLPVEGVIHIFTDRAQHQSNGLVERKIGQLNKSTRAALLASDLPAYLWPEVYMAMCHTQNIVPSSTLQRELKKEKKEQFENNMKKDGEEGSTPGEQGDAVAQAAADPLDVPVRDMIPYLAFHRDVTDEYFKHLVGQLKPWGVPAFSYHRRDNMRHLEAPSQKGFYMDPGSGPSMDQVFLKKGGTGAVKQFRHVLVPPAFAQQRAMRVHLAVERYPPPLYEKGTHEEERMGNVFQVAMRDEREHDAYDDEPFMGELAGLDMFDSIRAAPPDPKGEAVAVRGDNVPWDCGEHTALGTKMRRRPCTPTMSLHFYLAPSRHHRSLTVLC